MTVTPLKVHFLSPSVVPAAQKVREDLFNGERQQPNPTEFPVLSHFIKNKVNVLFKAKYSTHQAFQQQGLAQRPVQNSQQLLQLAGHFVVPVDSGWGLAVADYLLHEAPGKCTYF